MITINLPNGCDSEIKNDFSRLISMINDGKFPDNISNELEFEINRRLVDDKGKPDCHYSQQARAIFIVAERIYGRKI